MRPTTAFNDNVFDINALLHPGTVFNHPRDVLADPSLRAPAGLKAAVTIDEVLEALCELDGGPRYPPGGKPNRLRSTSRALAA